jgi:hypothetical protein
VTKVVRGAMAQDPREFCQHDERGQRQGKSHPRDGPPEEGTPPPGGNPGAGGRFRRGRQIDLLAHDGLSEVGRGLLQQSERIWLIISLSRLIEE